MTTRDLVNFSGPELVKRLHIFEGTWMCTIRCVAMDTVPSTGYDARTPKGEKKHSFQSLDVFEGLDQGEKITVLKFSINFCDWEIRSSSTADQEEEENKKEMKEERTVISICWEALWWVVELKTFTANKSLHWFRDIVVKEKVQKPMCRPFIITDSFFKWIFLSACLKSFLMIQCMHSVYIVYTHCIYNVYTVYIQCIHTLYSVCTLDTVYTHLIQCIHTCHKCVYTCLLIRKVMGQLSPLRSPEC